MNRSSFYYVGRGSLVTDRWDQSLLFLLVWIGVCSIFSRALSFGTPQPILEGSVTMDFLLVGGHMVPIVDSFAHATTSNCSSRNRIRPIRARMKRGIELNQNDRSFGCSLQQPSAFSLVNVQCLKKAVDVRDTGCRQAIEPSLQLVSCGCFTRSLLCYLSLCTWLDQAQTTGNECSDWPLIGFFPWKVAIGVKTDAAGNQIIVRVWEKSSCDNLNRSPKWQETVSKEDVFQDKTG